MKEREKQAKTIVINNRTRGQQINLFSFKNGKSEKGKNTFSERFVKGMPFTVRISK